MRMREWMESGGSLPDDSQLEEEMVSRMFWHDSKDRLVMEPKDAVKERIGCSPDWWDSLLLTFAYHVSQLTNPRGMRDASYNARQHLVAQQRDRDPLAGYGELDRLRPGNDYDPLAKM